MTVSAVVSRTITATPPPRALGAVQVITLIQMAQHTAICGSLSHVSVSAQMSNLYSVMRSRIFFHLSSSHAKRVLRTATLSKFVDMFQVVTVDTGHQPGGYSVPGYGHFHWNCLIHLTSTASGASVGWCCATNTQLFQVAVHSLGDTHDRF